MPISNVLAYAEPVLWAAACVALLRVRKHTALFAFGIFLGLRMLRAAMMVPLSRGYFTVGTDQHVQHPLSFFAQWGIYLASCVALFFALQELFINMMAPLPALRRLGLAAFRWAAFVALVLALSSIVTLASATSLQDHLNAVFTEIALSFSVLALCLLAFLGVSIRALGFSYRNRVSGLCLGLALLAATDLIVNGLRFSTIAAWPGQIASIGTFIALIAWIGVLAVPEPKPQAEAAVSSSALLWNDLAQELTPGLPHPATQQSGFLQDVESVVDRVLAKNSLGG